MVQVDEQTVEHVARLARLSLTAHERSTFARQLDEILRYAESIQHLDTDGVEPMSHGQIAGALREDVPHEGLGAGEALAPAPDAADGLFRVPRVIGG